MTVQEAEEDRIVCKSDENERVKSKRQSGGHFEDPVAIMELGPNQQLSLAQPAAMFLLINRATNGTSCLYRQRILLSLVAGHLDRPFGCCPIKL